MRKLMSDKELAKYTGLSLWSINELRRRGEIPFVKIGSLRRYYYEQSSIDEWLNNLGKKIRPDKPDQKEDEQCDSKS